MEEAIKASIDEKPRNTTPASDSPHFEEPVQEQEQYSSKENPLVLDLFEEALAKSETYQSGFWNGYFELSTESAEGYLSQKTILNNYQEELLLQEQNLREVNEQIHNNTNLFNELFSQLTKINYELNYQINLKRRRENDLSATLKQIERYQQENEELRNKHSFLGGLLFLVAAVAFILGDLIISHEIVAYALNIKNTVEAWSFAVGLAMVSVLLKPAYDRLIEYPYSQDKTLRSKRVYLIFKILIVIFTIATLCILGYFRYEAYRVDQLKNNINSNILALQEDETLETLKLLEQLSQKSEKLSQDLVNSVSGMWAFVLSGVMFAIAGAICLGIAFPILVAYVRIWFQIPMRLRRLEKIRLEQVKTIEEIELLISQQSAIAEAQKNQINNLGVLENLKNQKIELQKRILFLKERINKTETEIQISELMMGYEKGKKAIEKEKERQELKLQETEALQQKTHLAPIAITDTSQYTEANSVDNHKDDEKPLPAEAEQETESSPETAEILSIEDNNNGKPTTLTNSVLSKIKKKK